MEITNGYDWYINISLLKFCQSWYLYYVPLHFTFNKSYRWIAGVGGHKAWSRVEKNKPWKWPCGIWLAKLASPTETHLMSVGFVALRRHLWKLYGVRAAAHNCCDTDFPEFGVLQQSNSYVFAQFSGCACSEDFDTYCTYPSFIYTGLISLPKETEWGLQCIVMCAFVLFHTVTQRDLSLYKYIFYR